jgi:hypothetical protein
MACKKDKDMTSEILKRAGAAVVLGSLWFSYSVVLQILVIMAIAILMLSCVVLKFRDPLLQSRWKRLVRIFNIDVTFTVLALTMFLSGSRLLSSGAEAGSSAAVWAGRLTILAGGFFLGGAFGQVICDFILKLYHLKQKKINVA